MASSAYRLQGHILRRAVIDTYSHYFDGYKHYSDPWVYWKDPWINDFCFSVIIENSRQPGYFTEKIVECLQAGTIPIYWGCPNIGDYFDMDGIITFNNLKDLEPILQNLSFEEYNKRLAAVKKNYELTANYPTYVLSPIVHHSISHNNLGHVIDECRDRPDTFDKMWPYIKDWF